jgi:hypothetical protein
VDYKEILHKNVDAIQIQDKYDFQGPLGILKKCTKQESVLQNFPDAVKSLTRDVKIFEIF